MGGFSNAIFSLLHTSIVARRERIKCEKKTTKIYNETSHSTSTISHILYFKSSSLVLKERENNEKRNQKNM